MDMVLHPESNYGWSFQLYSCTCSPPVARYSYSASSLDVRFTDLSNSADYWLWDFGDETQSTEQNPTHKFVPGQYGGIGTSMMVTPLQNVTPFMFLRPMALIKYV